MRANRLFALALITLVSIQLVAKPEGMRVVSGTASESLSDEANAWSNTASVLDTRSSYVWQRFHVAIRA